MCFYTSTMHGGLHVFLTYAYHVGTTDVCSTERQAYQFLFTYRTIVRATNLIFWYCLYVYPSPCTMSYRAIESYYSPRVRRRESTTGLWIMVENKGHGEGWKYHSYSIRRMSDNIIFKI